VLDLFRLVPARSGLGMSEGVVVVYVPKVTLLIEHGIKN
jgi:hypothetical protein